jgi:PleD family two-component response regulator
VPITVSLGITVFQAALDLAPDSLPERADRALYRAKDEGRNRVAWE